ncbi:site-specific integrase [Priestia megaterium]|uniref:tyrosine-type recombinase/integrase n=1 Tax=Priestia megaterium TaxID=1404 RepID=UPI002E1F39CB|nr:site-specific integrase [Priestia megaterium]
MRVIKEGENYFGTVYHIYKNQVKIRTISVTRVHQTYEGVEYIFLLDSRGKVIKEVFNFINDYCKGEVKNSREQATSALKLFYSFLEIRDITVQDLDRNEVNNLSRFILGDAIEGNLFQLLLTTKRSIPTHNQYLDTIRKFMKFIEAKSDYLFGQTIASISKGGFGFLSHTKTITVNKYKTNITRHNSFDSYVPKYISLQEFSKVKKFIVSRNSRHNLRDLLIINLMFTRGMRLGEVLGLTLEDIKVHPKDPNAGILILRNRLSDKKNQQAKTCFKVFKKEDYNSNLYTEEGVGYQTITVPATLMEDLKKYIETSRDLLSLSDSVLDNIFQNSIADSLDNENEKNYYLFLNKNGTPLTAAGFNKMLKLVFVNIGISIDHKNKRNNLSHRFRHGYAMYLIENMNKDISYVKRELRHKSIQSTLQYYNPKQETILEHTKELEKKLLDYYKE